MATTQSSIGTIVGLSCFGDGLTDKSAELEIFFKHRNATDSVAMRVGAGIAPEVFAGFVAIAVEAYSSSREIEIEHHTIAAGTTEITRMTLPRRDKPAPL